MVVALRPGKFYGNSLPRPRFYIKLNGEERVDPPIPVTEPFMSWAEEAHWSMGGLSFKRHRLQGRIEGSVKKLRAEREKFQKEKAHKINDSAVKKRAVDSVPVESKRKVRRSPSPPPAPVAIKRRRYLGLVDDSEDEEEREVVRKNPARKLTEDFDRVAAESGMKKRVSSSNSPVTTSGSGSEGVGLRTRSRKSEQVEEKGGSTPTSRSRKSPRLVKRWA